MAESADRIASPHPGEQPRFLRALAREPVDTTPVWLMRQAGRYLPEYRALRAQAGSFLAMCTSPELACAVTLQPVERFPLDAAIIFSDILTIPHAMGLGLEFVEGEGPRFARPVRSAEDVARLGVPDPEADLGYVPAAIRLVRAALDARSPRVPVIGFAGSPWTVATYMVEGSGSRDFPRIRGMLYEAPDVAQRLLDVLTEATIAYLGAQARAGAEALMLFDTWGGVLTPALYRRFSLAPMVRVREGVRAALGEDAPPFIFFTKGGGPWLEEMAASGCEALGLDWTVDIGEARGRVGEKVALQGNLDPVALRASEERLRAEVRAVLDGFGPGAGHVFNLGHGITPDVPPERVAALVEEVHRHGRALACA